MLSKIKSLVFLLLVSYVCRSTGSDSYSPGAQCHDKKYLKCLKIPKHEEYDKCEDIIDTTYIEECEEVLETHCEREFAHVLVHVYDSHSFTLDSAVPKCHDKLSEVCHKIPKIDKHTQ